MKSLRPGVIVINKARLVHSRVYLRHFAVTEQADPTMSYQKAEHASERWQKLGRTVFETEKRSMKVRFTKSGQTVNIHGCATGLRKTVMNNPTVIMHALLCTFKNWLAMSVARSS